MLLLNQTQSERLFMIKTQSLCASHLITEGGLISPSGCMRGGGGGGSLGREYILSPVRFSSSFIWL